MVPQVCLVQLGQKVHLDLQGRVGIQGFQVMVNQACLGLKGTEGHQVCQVYLVLKENRGQPGTQGNQGALGHQAYQGLRAKEGFLEKLDRQDQKVKLVKWENQG